MRYPFLSFFIGGVAYFLLALLFIFTVFKKPESPKISLIVDAEVVDDVAQHAKSKGKFYKKSDLKTVVKEEEKLKKSSEERLEPHKSESNKELQNEKKNVVAKKTVPIYNPLPEIPDDLRFEAFNSYAIARFHITTSGMVINVELIKPCANPRLNYLLLKSLNSWKFNSSLKASTQDIRVTFKVE